ncbi:MAG: flagellar hook capping protein [Lachnospiraceae bacterium]|nr:flagellar hook capping protein [Lachnospiraceae bacterium]
MSAIANVVDGKITNNGATPDTSSISKAVEAAKKEAGGALDKDAFLQLLVTQMQYQDPLEPTDNTEYVSQLATFSTLEEMQNMSSTMDRQSASSLVGQYVFMEETSATGDTKTIEGTVDYVTFSGSKTYLSIDGTLYNYDDLKTVADSEYTLAIKLADTFVAQINKLPSIDALTAEDKESVGKVVEAYSAMNSYQKSFLTDDEQTVYNAYANWYSQQTGTGAGDTQESSAEGEDTGIV